MHLFVRGVGTRNHYKRQNGKKNDEPPVFQGIIAHQKFPFYNVVKTFFHFR
jgi:hypothetical protein